MNNHYLPFLEKVLTPRRLVHSLGVMGVMGELSEIYALDKEKAQTIGILHDAGKDLPEEKIKELMDAGNIQIQHEYEMNYVLYLHGPVGAYFVQKELGITDELILDAIKTHTFCGTSKYFDDPMVWCLKFSDLLEPGRNFGQQQTIIGGIKRIRDLAYSGRMKEGALLLTGFLINFFTEKEMPIHPTITRINHELGIEMHLAEPDDHHPASGSDWMDPGALSKDAIR
jgi:predicted HD superfamily hydrolase involved in NAD metabolism